MAILLVQTVFELWNVWAHLTTDVFGVDSNIPYPRGDENSLP